MSFDSSNDPTSPASPTSPTSPNTNYGTKTPSGNPRIYNCNQCNRAFTREEHLTRHTLLTHNKLKPYTCGICQRPFSRRDLLLRHAKNLHKGSELAVSRIRKSYKRENNTLNSVRGLGDFDGSPTSDPTSPRSPEVLSPATRRSIDNSDIMNSHRLLPLPHVNLPDISQRDILHQNEILHRSSISSHEPMYSNAADISPISNHLPMNRPISNNGIPNNIGSSLPNNIASSLPNNPGPSSSLPSSISPHPISYQSSSEKYDTPEKKRLKMSVNMLVS